jgi:hypothetical protein
MIKYVYAHNGLYLLLNAKRLVFQGWILKFFDLVNVNERHMGKRSTQFSVIAHLAVKKVDIGLNNNALVISRT